MARHAPLALLLLAMGCRPAPEVPAARPSSLPPSPARADNEGTTPLPAPEPARVLRPDELVPVRTRKEEGREITQLLFVFDHDDPDSVDDEFDHHPPEARAIAMGMPAIDEVWLFGPDGPCRATKQRVFASYYEDVVPTLELGWELDPCANDVAPVAHIGPNPPPLAWVSADVRGDGPITRGKWEDPLAAELEEQGLWDYEAEVEGERVPKPNFHTRIAEAGPVVELSFAQHWPGDACEEYEHTSTVLYARVGDDLVPLPESEDFSAWAELEGVLLEDGELVAAIGTNSFQLYVGTGPLEEGRYRWTEVITGHYHEEDTAYWAWSVLEAYCGP